MLKWFKIYFELTQRIKQRNEENRILRRALKIAQKNADEYYFELNLIKQRYAILLDCYDNISKTVFQEPKAYIAHIDKEETN